MELGGVNRGGCDRRLESVGWREGGARREGTIRTRGTALSIAVSVNFCGNLLVTFTLPSIQQWFDAIEPGKGISYLFGLYVAFCLLSLGFVAACVPETKGKSLEQIEAEMKE